jgi:hypothetical protein
MHRSMSKLDEVGARDGWRCWVCDEPVDASMSVNHALGPSIDRLSTDSKKRAKGDDAPERLAHLGCNSRKGAVKVEIAWPSRLFVGDPAPLLAVADRLQRKGGREVVARCPSKKDADETAAWLIDRFSRLVPELPVTTSIEPGGGQFMVALSTATTRRR